MNSHFNHLVHSPHDIKKGTGLKILFRATIQRAKPTFFQVQEELWHRSWRLEMSSFRLRGSTAFWQPVAVRAMACRTSQRLQNFRFSFSSFWRGWLPCCRLAVGWLRRWRIQQRRTWGKLLLISRQWRQLYRSEDIRALPPKEILLVSQILLNTYLD